MATSCEGCRQTDVTVIVPCHNEAVTVAEVVAGFRSQLPQARIIVADNVSTDDTAERARQAGAEVISVPAPGKGRAVRRLFEQCLSEVVVMVDGDATYDPTVVGDLVHLVACEGYDLVNASRATGGDPSAAGGEYRAGHQLGNRMLTGLQRRLTGITLDDILTGYKAMSRRFVSSLPIRSKRFQLEVEIASHAVAMDFAYTEVTAAYRARPAGSTSKLSTYRDGWSILRMLLRLHRDLHPFVAFTALSAPWFVASIALVVPPVVQYFRTGQVAKFPSLIAGVATFLVGMLLVMSGWILERTRALRRDVLLVTANDLERQIAISDRAQYLQSPRSTTGVEL
ncbi:MAG TPA: glycosyltransferase family 2 protein [Mycobacteriales bacterium]|nr:glycosyltransferase family 2 protein [Mycobacteriales bacterium]